MTDDWPRTRDLEAGLMANTRPAWRQKYNDERQDAALFAGLLVGLAVGLLWEAIRR